MSESSLQNMNISLKKITNSSKDISNIILIINDILDRINLLSLNAAIDAACAGRAGRGFAVVANEVSKLANQTASSIKAIDTLIKVNNNEIDTGMRDVANVVNNITNVITTIISIMDMLSKIHSNVEKQMDFNRAISSQAEIVKSQSHDIMVPIGDKSAQPKIVKSINEMNVQNELTIQEADKIS